ncbi:MAG: zinc-binding dehydrogenase [Woeseiaceae bacterium]|nr:zinc-binding dehydrogenase [Woeseiaceae bacterium]
MAAACPLSRVGERVRKDRTRQYGRRFGTAAEKVAIDSRRAPALPDKAGFDIGALPWHPGHDRAPLRFCRRRRSLAGNGAGDGRCRPGRSLCHPVGGAGRRARNRDGEQSGGSRRLYASGAAGAVVNHRESEWSAGVLDANAGQRVDRVIDVEFGANLEQVLKLIRVGGTIATYSSTQVAEPRLPFRDMMFMDLTIRMVIVYAMPEVAKEQAIADIARALRSDVLSHRIAHALPLGEIAGAHELIEQGNVRGCVVVTLD